MENSPVVEAFGLRKTYGKLEAVSDATFSLHPGEIVGFLGPNGAGKTTTIKMLTGLLAPTAGRAVINGHDIQKEPVLAKAAFGYVPDTPNLYGKLTGVEFLQFMARLYRVPREQAEHRARELLRLFQLADASTDLVEGYSHGMQQKMALAGALIHDPKVLMLDEPTVGLDPKSARMIKDILGQLRDRGTAIFFSTHILEIAVDIAAFATQKQNIVGVTGLIQREVPFKCFIKFASRTHFQGMRNHSLQRWIGNHTVRQTTGRKRVGTT